MGLLEFINSNTYSPVTIFTAKQYPATFCNWFLTHNHRMSACQVIDLESCDLQTVTSQLQVSFLGQSRSYWLRNISELPARVRTDLLELLLPYHGPNTLFFFACDTDISPVPKFWHKVTIPDELDESQFIEVVSRMAGVDRTYAAYVSQLLFAQRATLTFDAAFLILPYLHLIQGKYLAEFVTNWVDELVPSQGSLFVLSKLFFEKNGRAFFEQWGKIRDQYVPQFWIVFWAEQLWRAAWYVTIARQKNRADLKKISYRLPFSFVQQGWHKTSVRELKAAHEFVYGLDYASKNGGGTVGLELFFNQFFESRFI